ncbi:uncharacterized protein [Nicotiana tomentosiformis]|uniref:uncharacterized protein n=1 Tax=Nicotiana tomentosiformis TaxID=4098 RepID=UPI00388CE95C
MRPLSSEGETSIPASKPAKEKKRKKSSPSEDPEPKKKKARKPRKNIIHLTVESVRCLREEDEGVEEDDSGLVARVGMSTEAPKATKSVKAAETLSRDEGVSGRDLGEVPESSRIENAPTTLSQRWASRLYREAFSRSRAELNRTRSRGSSSSTRIEQLREEVNMMKAETLGWKEGMDRFAAEKETALSKLSSAESQLRGMKEKISIQAKKKKELEARLASELAKAKSEAEKPKVEAEAIVVIYQADAEASQVQAIEATETAQTRAYWIVELAKCQSLRETLEEIHTRGFDLTNEIVKAREHEAEDGALAISDDDDDYGSKSGSVTQEFLKVTFVEQTGHLLP